MFQRGKRYSLSAVNFFFKSVWQFDEFWNYPTISVPYFFLSSFLFLGGKFDSEMCFLLQWTIYSISYHDHFLSWTEVSTSLIYLYRSHFRQVIEGPEGWTLKVHADIQVLFVTTLMAMCLGVFTVQHGSDLSWIPQGIPWAYPIALI